jgi:flagellar biosynthetic protein FliO
MLAAAPGDASPLGANPDLPSFGGLLLKTVLALAIVVVLAWVLLRWGLKRLVPGARGDERMRVLARLPLDGRRQVVLVKAYGKYLLLGVGDGAINLLRELTGDEVRAADEAAAEARPKRSFAEVLRTVLRRDEKGAAEPAKPASAEEEKRDE